MSGRRPKLDGMKRNRVASVHDWLEVEDVPFEGAPDLPRNRLAGRAWPAQTKRWWAAVSSMPHCVLWGPSDWSFAIDSALLAAEMHAGNVRLAAEVRQREKVMGTTGDARLGLRIRYMPVADKSEHEPELALLDVYRRRLQGNYGGIDP